MKKTFLLIILLTLFSVSIFAQENITCPTVKVRPAVEVFHQKETITFSADIIGEAKGLQFEYKWTVSSGVIKQGQGTPAILVSDVEAENVVATIEIKGFPQNCINKSNATAIVKPIPPISDNFPIQYQNRKDLIARLNMVATELNSNSELKALFIYYNGANGNKMSFDSFKSEVIRTLVKFQKISRERISIIKGGNDYDSNSFRVWFIDKIGNTIY